jgi:hypothetical protein
MPNGKMKIGDSMLMLNHEFLKHGVVRTADAGILHLDLENVDEDCPSHWAGANKKRARRAHAARWETA